jgi:hypothetical protein
MRDFWFPRAKSECTASVVVRLHFAAWRDVLRPHSLPSPPFQSPDTSPGHKRLVARRLQLTGENLSCASVHQILQLTLTHSLLRLAQGLVLGQYVSPPLVS